MTGVPYDKPEIPSMEHEFYETLEDCWMILPEITIQHNAKGRLTVCEPKEERDGTEHH